MTTRTTTGHSSQGNKLDEIFDIPEDSISPCEGIGEADSISQDHCSGGCSDSRHLCGRKRLASEPTADVHTCIGCAYCIGNVGVLDLREVGGLPGNEIMHALPLSQVTDKYAVSITQSGHVCQVQNDNVYIGPNITNAAMMVAESNMIVMDSEMDIYADIVEASPSAQSENKANTSKRRWQRKMRKLLFI